jgi:glycosyltransferase involved in cell wall biosynthesis
VLTVHDLLPHDSGDAYRQTFRKVYRMVDRIICHSDHIRTRLGAEFSVTEEKISVIPHGPFFYDLPAVGSEQTLQSFQVEPDRVTVLWQGIIFPYKGIDLLLHAWQKVEANCENACLVMVGTGATDLLDQIREQVRQLDLKRVKLHFRFISTEELVSLYRAADVVVYPYRAITTSGALATGLAMAKAIVASDLPVFRELLVDQENALLVDPQDSFALASALTELVQDAALRERLVGNVRQMNFGDHSWQSIAKETIKVYESVLSDCS